MMNNHPPQDNDPTTDVPRGPLVVVCIAAVLLLTASPGLSADADGSDPWAPMSAVLERIGRPQIPDAVYDPTEFGAVGDGRTDDRAAIQAAIDQANADGGGIVRLGDGLWFSHGPVHLKSNVFLDVPENARLLFTDDTDAYLPQVRTRWEGTEVYNYSPFIYAYQAINVGVTGKGVIDGNAADGFGRWRGRQGDSQRRLREMGAAGKPVRERLFGPGDDTQGDYLRPSMIQFYGCQNVLIRDVTIVDSPMWVNHLVYCHNVIVSGLTVDSRRLNNDGVAVDSSVNVLIENCVFRTGDDSVVVKSGRDRDGWRVGRPSENVIVRHNQMSGHNALAVGSEMSGGVRNIYMHDNELGRVRSAIYFKSNLDRGGAIENVRVRDINVDRADRLIRFRTDYHGYRGGDRPPLYRDFLIENVRATRVGTLIQATGVTASPIRDVRISNVIADEAERELDVSYVENFTLKEVYANGEPVEYSGPDRDQ